MWHSIWVYLAYLLAFYLPVEVQWCTLSWADPGLRSSGAHWAGKLAKSLAKSWQGGNWGGNWCRHGRGETSGGEGGWRRRKTRRRRRTTLIKSNNPHLAGGEKIGSRHQWTIEAHCRFTSYFEQTNQLAENNINPCGMCNSAVWWKIEFNTILET